LRKEIETVTETACPCGSNKLFSTCCQPLLRGDAEATDPEQLMRSRYSAYALGGHGQYLLATWFPATAVGLTADELSTGELEWCGLQVLDSAIDGDAGSVEFRASYRDAGGRSGVLHEKAVFRRSAGRWLYVGGEVSVGKTGRRGGGGTVSGTLSGTLSGTGTGTGRDPGRNAPCPCGSGRKFKHCCLK